MSTIISIILVVALIIWCIPIFIAMLFIWCIYLIYETIYFNSQKFLEIKE